MHQRGEVTAAKFIMIVSWSLTLAVGHGIDIRHEETCGTNRDDRDKEER